MAEDAPRSGDTYTRRIRDLDLGTKQCFLLFIERRGRYDAVAAIVALRSGASWTSTASTRNKRFEDYLSTLCANITLTDAASVAGINEKAAKRIESKYLSQLATGLDDLNQKRLEIDKIAYEKGHLQACGGNPKTGDVPELLT